MTQVLMQEDYSSENLVLQLSTRVRGNHMLLQVWLNVRQILSWYRPHFQFLPKIFTNIATKQCGAL